MKPTGIEPETRTRAEPPRRLSLEAAPRLISDTLSDAEPMRLADRIGSQPDLAELVDSALSREERLRSQEAA